jgi:ABC-type transport system involved in cytochrome c biogenesis ATPase subunit
MVALGNDVYTFGLRGTIDPERNPDLAQDILRAREALRERLEDPEVAVLVEGFHKDSYNTNATVAENLLFGNPVGDAFNADRLAENEYVLKVLDDVGLTDTILSTGYQVAATMVELFADLPPDHEFFEQFAFISSDDLPEFQALLSRASRDKLEDLKEEDRTRLMSLPFKLIPARHRLGLIGDDFRDKILEARSAFAAGLPDDLRDKIAFFDANAFNPAANLQDNILFGKIAYGQAHAADRVGTLIGEVIDELGLRRVVAEVGLSYEAGIAGSRLSGAQRQKLGIARAILKRPDLLIVSEATAALDSASQAKIMEAVIDEMNGRGLIWVLHRSDMARFFDRILVMRAGRVVENGTPDELDREGTQYRDLVSNE